MGPDGKISSTGNLLGVLVPIQGVFAVSGKRVQLVRVVSIPCKQVLRGAASVGHHNPFKRAVPLFEERPVSSKAYLSAAKHNGYGAQLVGVVDSSVGSDALSKNRQHGQSLGAV